MMKKNIKHFITLIAVVVLSAGYIGASLEFAPYYNYNFTEGLSVSPAGKLGFLVNLSNDIGIIMKPVKAHSLIGFYSVKYQGPGLKQQEGQEFSERYLDHLFVGRHHWYLPAGITVKSQFDVLLEARRAGTNETWENGLYNFNRYGGMSALAKKFGPVEFTGMVKYHFMSFPNYTDLLAELRSGADASASEGQQNHHIYEVGGKAVYKNNKANVIFGQQLYTKQKTAVDSVQSDGTFYSSVLQKDFNISGSLSREQIVGNFLVAEPNVLLGYKNSNQNYQHFETETSTVPVSFHADYFDYYTLGFDLPLTLGLSKKWSLLLSPSWSYKKYMSRSPRDVNGNFLLAERQSRLLSIYTIGLKNQIGESSSSMLFFTYQTQASNMKYEQVVFYNYVGYSFGLRFQMEY